MKNWMLGSMLVLIWMGQVACGSAGNPATCFTIDVPADQSGWTVDRHVEPESVVLTPALDAFFTGFAGHFVAGDANGMAGMLAADFLHEGQSGIAFANTWAARSKAWGIRDATIVSFGSRIYSLQRDGCTLMVGGFVQVNGQVIGIFRKGMRIAERYGQWKLVGNGSAIPTGIWQAGTLVTMVAPPDNLMVYQSLLPAGMSLPQNPLVRVVAADWTSIANGWRPYRLIAVYIQVVFNGRLGWYTVTMPENDWLPVMAGIAVGLPKYVADITSIGDASGWHSAVSVAGDSRIAMTFSPAASVPVAVADVPSFQLSPFDSHIVIETSFSVYGSLGTVTPGLATIGFPAGAPWFGLLNQGSAKPAYFANAPNFQMDMISEPH
jgi:hypothetical protein